MERLQKRYEVQGRANLNQTSPVAFKHGQEAQTISMQMKIRLGACASHRPGDRNLLGYSSPYLDIQIQTKSSRAPLQPGELQEHNESQVTSV